MNKPITETFTEDELICVVLGLDTTIKVLETRNNHPLPHFKLDSNELQLLEECKKLHAKLNAKHF